jgi:hypothetical protein
MSAYAPFGWLGEVYTHSTLGVHSNAVHNASSVSPFICLGWLFNKALMDGADKL